MKMAGKISFSFVISLKLEKPLFLAKQTTKVEK
jgi:hypothetical protein